MPAKTEKFKPWRVCFLPQLAHLQGKDEHAYERFGQARDFVNNQIDDWKGWCKRYNSAGLKVLDEMSRRSTRRKAGSGSTTWRTSGSSKG